ncbi:MAG: pyridoxal-phosphate dependent enzyme [Candidatus Thalassarchaeaceae archaeon]|nr:pyridoxal-phosphate dependent enzyme [Candidatus Thalassarchaeaceae archaeon]
MPVDFEDVRAAASRIEGIVAHTPVLTSLALDSLAGRRLFFKCENLQHVGAFKFRGASNAIALLGEEAERGICTHSSGNHAQAVALAAKQRGVSAYIVMPENAPRVKIEGVRSHGAEITFCEPTLEARERTAAAVMERTGAAFVHPFDDPRVVAGQGTAALELINEVGPLDAIIAPIGGGGLLSGTCVTTRALLPEARIFGAEPTGADDAARSLAAGHLIPNKGTNTICDGLLTSLCNLTFGILNQHLESIITISDEEVLAAMKLLQEHLDIIVEPSGATVLAAILTEEFRALKDIGSVGLVISGGNLDPGMLPK